MTRLFAVLLLASAAHAQSSPQLVWQAEVDGIATLHIRGNRLESDTREGAPVFNQRFRFYDRLPERNVDVQMRVTSARGRVYIEQQPRLQNNYTLSVVIEDRQAGRATYALEFAWRQADPVFDRRPPGSFSGGRDPMERLAWSGRVDDEAVVVCRASACESRTARGGKVTRDRFKFSRPLPEREIPVSLEGTDGRGEIRLIEQPSGRNNYSAVVMIRDPQPGPADYGFTLVWSRQERGSDAPLFARRGFTWNGRVDGKARVILQGGITYTEVVSGAPVAVDRADFERPLDPRPAPNAAVTKLEGRGRVEIVEFPSERNGYRLVFEIDDAESGAGFYVIEVGW